MFDEMGGEYDRFRIENIVRKTTLGEMLQQKKIKIISKLTKAN